MLATATAWSTAATWVLVILMAGALSIDAAIALVPVAGVGLACTVSACAGLLAWAPTDSAKDPASPLGRTDANRVRVTLALASMLFVITLAVSYAQHRFGQTGLMLSVAMAGLADARAPVASLAAMFDGGQLPRSDLIMAVLLAITANSGTRLVVALVSGGLASGVRVGAALASELIGAWIAWAWLT